MRLGISEATVGTYWGRVRIKIGPYNRTELVSIYLRTKQEEALENFKQENAQIISDLQEATRQSSIYEELIENAPDAILLVAETGVIASANLAAHELFGYEPGELNGFGLWNLFPHRFRDEHRDHREQYMSDPRRRQMGTHLQTPAIHKHGSEILVRVALSAMKTPTGLLVTTVVRRAEDYAV